MFKIKHLLIIGIALFSTIPASAQIGTNSPYTRFGYGEINNISFSASRAMGGIGVGYRNKKSINPVNPASYSSVDTLTFMFDLGGSAKYSSFKSGGSKSDNFNGNFDYITLLFPVSKWMGISLGLNPYSTVGYNFSSTDSLKANSGQNPTNTDIVFKQTYDGSGGISQIYGGASVKLFNHLSLGVNAYYLFGNITHYKESVLTSASGYTTSQNNNLHISDFRLRYGLQYFTTIKQKHDITIGGIFENKSSLNGDYEFITKGGGMADTITTDYGFGFPNTYAGGIYYTYDKKFSLGVDYMFQDWNKAKYYGKTDSLANVHKLSVGMEYLPDMYSPKYYKRIRYRAGFSISNSYIKMDDKLNNFSITAGVGIPFRRNASVLNVGFEYGKNGENTRNMIKEDYFKITLSATFVERWFLKNVIR